MIPTRDRAAALDRCLAALCRQHDVDLEILVVDDGSTEVRAVERIAGRYPGVAVVRLDGRGPAAARNAGIRATTGDVVLLIDDDCVPAPSWASELARVASSSDCLAAGRTDFDAGRLLVAASEAIVTYVERRDGFATTRNVGLRRAVAASTPFDERFPEAGGEDREWCRRLRGKGISVVPAEAAVLRHDPELDLRGFWRQHVRYGRAARLDHGASRGGVRRYSGLIAAGSARGWRVGILVLVAQLATVVGYVGSRLEARS